MPRQRPIDERYWEKIAVLGPDECWPWLGYRSPDGYGYIRYQKVPIQAHRVGWALANGGDMPGSIVIRHSCDNPPCQNPSHLLGGTYADNNKDISDRGRAWWQNEDIKSARSAKLRLRRRQPVEVPS